MLEAIGNVAARNLHPHVVDTFEKVDFPVGNLVDHLLGIVADELKPSAISR